MIIHSAGTELQLRDTLVVWKSGRRGLQALSVGGYESRHQALCSLLEQAEREHGLPDFGPVLVHTLDRPIRDDGQARRSYALCTTSEHGDVAVPDFVFGGWPEVGIDDFDETARAMAAAGAQPASRPQVGWIGNCDTEPVRWALHALGQEHPTLLDVHHVAWVREQQEVRLGSAASNHLTLPEQVSRWGALLDVEGKGYSGRLKLLLHSGRPVLVQDRPWREFFWDQLVPGEHYLPVRRDLSDLLDVARWVQQHPQEAQRVGRAGQQLAQRLLTRSSAVEVWARTLAGAADVTGHATWAPQPLHDQLTPVLRTLGAPVPRLARGDHDGAPGAEVAGTG